MADIWSKEKRSQVMSRICSKDTRPERSVRSLLHKMGYRFRLHVKNLPGRPDIVFPKHKKIIFVHGCFWHLHKGCRDGTIPKTRQKKWKAKLERNVERDNDHLMQLRKKGWKTLVVWECEVEKHPLKLQKNIERFLGATTLDRYQAS